MDPQKLQTLIIAIPAILIAITYHEIAHGYVADRLGDPTARMLGRLSPNPIKHIDPIGTILIPIVLHLTTGFIFGYAKPVPVNMRNLRDPLRDMAIVAAAGPITNVVMAIASTLLLRLIAPLAHPAGLPGILMTLFNGAPINPQGVGYVLLPVALVLAFMVIINVVLAVFNMVPIPPLDGGRIMVGILPTGPSQKLAAIEPFGFFILIGILVIDPLGIWSQGFGRVIRALISVLLG